MKPITKPVWCASIAVMAATIAPSMLRGQEPRLRTLTYETGTREWVEVAPPLPGTNEGDLFLIRDMLRRNDFRRALAATEAFIKKYGPGDALHPDVLVAKADALIGRKDFMVAHETLQAMLGEYGSTAATSDALRLEFVIAESFLSGAKRKLWGMPLLSGEDVALQILGEISAEYPGNRYAELAIKTKADYQFKTGSHALAEQDYNRLMREYPHSRYYQYAMRRAAESALASFAGVWYDDAALVEAAEQFGEYRTAFPSEANQEGIGLVLDSIREMRADKEYLVGRQYETTNHLSSAAFYYQLVRDQWPDSIAATKAATRLELMGVLEVVPVAPIGENPGDS